MGYISTIESIAAMIVQILPVPDALHHLFQYILELDFTMVKHALF